MKENQGTACAFAVIQSMIEWIEGGLSVWNGLLDSSDIRNIGESAEVYDDSDDEGAMTEEEERRIIEEATKEAFYVAGEARKCHGKYIHIVFRF